mmetsp:Transcript_10933/g.17816  ORF Transcript_10933/g.17816 Transcript_10933/m.17816 type:complete len:296 (+) Transcript_10933:2943-3830(+)
MHSCATALFSTTTASMCLPAATETAWEYLRWMGRHKSARRPCTPLKMRCMELSASAMRSSCLPRRRASPTSRSFSCSCSSSARWTLSCASIRVASWTSVSRVCRQLACSCWQLWIALASSWRRASHSAMSFSPVASSRSWDSCWACRRCWCSCLLFRSSVRVRSSARSAAIRALTSSRSRVYSASPAASSCWCSCPPPPPPPELDGCCSASSSALSSSSTSVSARISPSNPLIFSRCCARSVSTFLRFLSRSWRRRCTLLSLARASVSLGVMPSSCLLIPPAVFSAAFSALLSLA